MNGSDLEDIASVTLQENSDGITLLYKDKTGELISMPLYKLDGYWVFGQSPQKGIHLRRDNNQPLGLSMEDFETLKSTKYSKSPIAVLLEQIDIMIYAKSDLMPDIKVEKKK